MKGHNLFLSISSAKNYIHPLIHLLIPLFLCHFIQMFPELVLIQGVMSCWGLGHNATSFFFFHLHLVLLHAALPIFSVWKSVYGIHVSAFGVFMCLHVES